MIEPGQVGGDILHISDLFTTFTRLGGGTKYIPTDRVIDGVDQTSLFFNGDGSSRRDHLMVCPGPNLAGAVKGRFKRDWATALEGLSGVEFYDLYADPREAHGEITDRTLDSLKPGRPGGLVGRCQYGRRSGRTA